MAVNTLKNNYNYRSSQKTCFVLFKTKQDHPKTYQHTGYSVQHSLRESTINADFRHIAEAGRAEDWNIYFHQKGTFENTCRDWLANYHKI